MFNRERFTKMNDLVKFIHNMTVNNSGKYSISYDHKKECMTLKLYKHSTVSLQNFIDDCILIDTQIAALEKEKWVVVRHKISSNL